MPKINILESNIYNRISAGEVVERPASIVKELVENSIDAGADNITVEIVRGGIEEIRVTDNGCGLETGDLKNAFLPHATSKIASLDDLDAISSLGFRGEALASIAAVGMVEMRSKIKDAECGGIIEISGGKVERLEATGCADGTQTVVRNLFFNTPARAKFLKKPKSEEGEITNLMARFLLVNDKRSFRYIADGKTIYQSNGTGLADAIYVVYGAEAVKNLIPVSGNSGDMKISGYIGRPSYTKPNKTYQTVALNGRYIVNTTVSAAIHNVYAEYLMKRNYPFYVLNLSLPFDSVDVNVHPNKLDVRFENSSAIYSLVYHAVSKAVADFNRSQMDRFREQSEAAPPAPPLQSVPVWRPPIAEPAFPRARASVWKPATDESAPYVPMQELHDSGPVLPVRQEVPTAEITESHPEAAQERELSERYLEPDFVQHSMAIEQQDLSIPVERRVLGQVFQSYILVESGEELLIIDQHAAHERLLFDRLERSVNEREVTAQNLLVPYVFTLNPLEEEFFRQQLPYLLEIGFGVEEFGSNAYRVNAVPYDLSGVNLKAFLDDVVSDMAGRRSKTSESIRDILAQKACKAAVKAGMPLSESEIDRLLLDMREGSVLQCPHGRPVIHRIAKREIEKWFKRIV